MHKILCFFSSLFFQVLQTVFSKPIPKSYNLYYQVYSQEWFQFLASIFSDNFLPLYQNTRENKFIMNTDLI